MPDLNPAQFWHGTPSGDLRGGSYGLHVGTQQAAHEALTARIGHPAEGTWDGSREYGKTLLAGKRSLRERGIFPTGYSTDAPEEDHYPLGTASYGGESSGRQPVALNSRPTMIPLRITGPMTNTPQTPHDDFRANGMMHGQIKRGTARRGYFYTNAGEDFGSVSAVVPNEQHVRRVG
jgi:hypothetical protein